MIIIFKSYLFSRFQRIPRRRPFMVPHGSWYSFDNFKLRLTVVLESVQDVDGWDVDEWDYDVSFHTRIREGRTRANTAKCDTATCY